MSYTSDGQGWLPQPPFRLTRGDYMATGSQYFKIGEPGKVKAQGWSGADEYGKFIVEQYTDTNGIEDCVGYCLRNLPAVDHADERYLGLGSLRRDKRFMTFGEMNVLYCTGTNPAPANMALAPHPSGVQEWTPGKRFIGTMRQEAIYTGAVGYALIDISQSRAKTIVKEETIATWVDAGDNERAGELTYIPTNVQWIHSGSTGFQIMGTGAGHLNTTYNACIDYSTTTSGVILPSGLDMTTVNVRYEYYKH